MTPNILRQSIGPWTCRGAFARGSVVRSPDEDGHDYSRLQMGLIEEDDFVQTFFAYCSYPPFRQGIGIRYLVGGVNHSVSFCHPDGVS